MKRAAVVLRESTMKNSASAVPSAASSSDEVTSSTGSVEEITLEFQEHEDTAADVRRRSRHWLSDAPPRDTEDVRAESYYWPRILRTPLKRSGHVILETCTKEGESCSCFSYLSLKPIGSVLT